MTTDSPRTTMIDQARDTLARVFYESDGEVSWATVHAREHFGVISEPGDTR